MQLLVGNYNFPSVVTCTCKRIGSTISLMDVKLTFNVYHCAAMLIVPLMGWMGLMALTHCPTQIRIRTRIFVLFRNRDLSLGTCNVDMFCIVQCSHWVWNQSPSLNPCPSPAMYFNHKTHSVTLGVN